MIANQIKDILVPIAEFPRIRQDATLREAFALLHKQHTSGGWRYRHMLVFDAANTVVGVLSLQDLLRALMPDYIKATMTTQHAAAQPVDASLSLLWQESFPAQCRQAAEIAVASCMTEIRYTVQASKPLTCAAYLMIAHQVHMLPVLENEQVVGVVRIVDIFNQAAAEVLHG